MLNHSRNPFKSSHILKQKDVYNVNPSLHKIDLVWHKEKANQTHLYLNLMIKNNYYETDVITSSLAYL